jgi:hypothetical protein
MYFFKIGSFDGLSKSLSWFETRTICAMPSSAYISIGQDHVMDIDTVEHTWLNYGYLLFFYDEEPTYYILLPTNVNIPLFWNEIDSADPLTAFYFLFEKRFLQRLRTRKIIKEYKQEAARRVSDSSSDSKEDILLGMLERIMTMKKGEELYWFRDYDQALLEKEIKELHDTIEYKFRPGNEGFMKASESFTDSIQEIVNKQHC